MDEALPSMKVKLMPHQVIGVAWMLDMERNAKRKGGILADSMGLGKTIQMVSAWTVREHPSTMLKPSIIDRYNGREPLCKFKAQNNARHRPARSSRTMEIRDAKIRQQEMENSHLPWQRCYNVVELHEDI